MGRPTLAEAGAREQLEVLNKDKEMPAVADLLITLIKSDEEEDTHMFTEMMKGPAISEFVNLEDKNGTTALHAAFEVNSLDKVQR